MHLPPTEHLPDVAGSPTTSAVHHPRTDNHDGRFEEEIDLGQYLRPLRRHWMLIGAAAALGAVAGLLVAARRPTLYEASTTVLVQQAASGEAFSTARALLHNYTLAAETINELGMTSAPYNLTPQGFVNSALVVDESGGTHLLNVRVRLADPAMAAKASHLLSSKAVELNRRVATEGNRAVRDQLKVLLDDASRRLDAAEKELLSERTRAQLELVKKDAEVTIDGRAQYQRLSRQIESERGRLQAAEEELTRQPPLLGSPRTPAAEEAMRLATQLGSAPPPAAAEARQPAADARTRPAQGEDRQERQPGSRPSPADPASTMADPRLLDLSNPFVNPVYQTLQFQIATSRAQLAGLERERRQMTGAGGPGKDLSQLYRGELAVARLETNYDLAKRVFSELAVRYEQSRAESVGNMVQLQIVDPAMPPDRPMPRKRVESALVGAAGGFFFAALVAIFVTPKEADGVLAGAPGRAHSRS